MKLTIKVTQTDINNGGCHSDSCPIARAIKRQLNPYHISVGGNRIMYWKHSLGLKDSGEVRISAPLIASQFIEQYDRHDLTNPVEPFEFEIEVPE